MACFIESDFAMQEYTFLFPFEKIRAKSDVLIYGAGNTGIEYLKQIKITNYCRVIGFVDKNAANINNLVVPVFSLKEVTKMKFDYIIIAMKNPTYNNKIIDDLSKFNVPQDKIVFVGKRKEIDSLYVKNMKSGGEILAFERKGISVAVQVPSGIGDVIISKRFIKQLQCFSTYLNIDIYCSNDMASIFYDQNDGINAIITPSKGTFYSCYDSYHIAVSIQFILNFFSFKFEEIKTFDNKFAHIMKKLYKSVQKYNDDCAVNERLRIFFERADYANKMIYHFPDYFESVLAINDTHVDIPLREEWKMKFDQQYLSDYITINFGNGIGSNNISKQWPLGRFSELVDKIKKKYPRLKIIQLGVVEADKITNCDNYLLGENLELVKYVLLNSFLHIDIEGGLVHIATQLGTKCVVLFGPTSIKAFGYPTNINIKAGDCHNCCGVESNFYQCARYLETPACMEAISVDMVYKEVDNYLSNIL